MPNLIDVALWWPMVLGFAVLFPSPGRSELLGQELANPEHDAADIVVVCPDVFGDALQPWLAHRRDEGMRICVLPSSNDARALHRAICDAACEQTRYVVLVGDAPVFGAPCDRRTQTPIFYAPTKVTSAWGAPPTLSSDLAYGDFDLDHHPDAVVGRLPVDEPEQLTQWISRIIARDNSRDFGEWRNKVQLVGGVGGFGPLVDGAIETVTRTIVTTMLPTDTHTTVTCASPGNPFFPTDRPFTDAVIQRYCDGARFWVYAGHGQITHLDRVPNSVDGIPVLDSESVKRLDRPSSSAPIALMLACYTGAMDAAEDSIAEEMVLSPGGPIAVLAGSRITMPYGNTTAAVGLIDGIFAKRLPRLGDAWLSALEQMHQEQTDAGQQGRMMIDWLAKMVSPANSSLVDERREHMYLYNLIGDPTLRLHHPQSLTVETENGVSPGEAITATIASPIDGHLTVTVDRPLGGVSEGDPNVTTIATVSSQVTGDRPFSARILLPAEVSGPMIIRARVSGDQQWASGATRIIVR